MEEKEKRISYRAPLSRWKALTDLATSRESSIQHLIDEALDATYFEASSANVRTPAPTPIHEPPPGDPRAKYYEMLGEILSSGIREYIFALIMNLTGWGTATRDRQGKPPRPDYAIPEPAELAAELVRLTEVAKASSRQPEKRKKSA